MSNETKAPLSEKTAPASPAATPRTDAHLSHLNLPDGRKVGIPDETVKLLKTLERESAALRTEVEALKGRLADREALYKEEWNRAEAAESALAAAKESEREQFVPIGWCQELSTGKRVFHEGDLDPREVHDNGKPCYRVFRNLKGEA